MGFLPISIGVMLLFDLQIALTRDGAVYAVLDVFPNVLGFALILIGLIRLARRGETCRKETACAAFLTVVSLFVLAKDTLLYGSFYADGIEIVAGQTIGFCQHLLILGFLVLLFRRTGKALLSLEEDRLAQTHGRVTGFALAEGIVYVLCYILGFVPGFPENALSVIKLLDMLFWIALVWYGGISQLRAALRVN